MRRGHRTEYTRLGRINAALQEDVKYLNGVVKDLQGQLDCKEDEDTRDTEEVSYAKQPVTTLAAEPKPKRT